MVLSSAFLSPVFSFAALPSQPTRLSAQTRRRETYRIIISFVGVSGRLRLSVQKLHPRRQAASGARLEVLHVLDEGALICIAEFTPVGVTAILDEVRAHTDLKELFH